MHNLSEKGYLTFGKLAYFAEWIVSLDDDDPNSPGRKERQTVTLTQIINRAKEALDG